MSDNVFNRPLDLEGEDAIPTNFEEFKKVVKSRRSVRVFRPEPVPDEVVRECIDLALLAPNSSNLQAWEFHWIRSENVRRKVVEACLSQPAAKTAPVLIVAVARRGTWREMRARMIEVMEKAGAPTPALDYYRKLVPMAYTVGPFGIVGLFKKLAVTVMGFKQALPREPWTPGQVRLWAEKTTALGCENLMLSFRAAGYDTCPMEGFDKVRLRKALDLPRDASVVMVISAGRREKRGVYGPQVRLPRELFVKEH